MLCYPLLPSYRMEVNMALQLREGTLNFPPTTGRRQRTQVTVVLPSAQYVPLKL